MPHNRTPTSSSKTVVAQLACARAVQSLDPIAARFIYSLRLVALHNRVKRDPIPELAGRLASVEIAAKAFALAQMVAAVWPEDVHVSRFCCSKLTHDEATIAAMIEGAIGRDQQQAEATVQGLIRPERITALWGAVLALVEAELSAI